MRSGQTVVTTCVVFTLACLPMVARGSVIYVDANAAGANDGSSWTDAYREVQSALAVAAANDEIWVAAGTYKPDYNVGSGTHTGDRTATFQLKTGVVIYGGFPSGGGAWEDRDPAANETTLSGDLAGDDGPDFANNTENSYHVVTGSGTAATAIIDGFTIRAGNANGPSTHVSGAGVYIDHGGPTITNNTITTNNSAAGNGSGIYCSNYSSPTIARNTITANNAPSGAGGGIFVSSSSSATITNNAITGNSANLGGGIRAAGSAMIANNTIVANSAALSGGGIHTSYSPMIVNNTITGNGAASAGGGIYASGTSSFPTIANTIVAFNSSGICSEQSATPVLRYNCVYGNAAYNYSGITDPTGTDGNISADPKLAGAQYGNVHIQPDSPCKDSGINSYAYGAADMDGQARIQPGGGTVDIGADESDGTIWPGGPNVIVRVGPDGDDDNDGSSWELAKRTVQGGIDAASAEGGDVWVQAGTYYERITLQVLAHVYGGFEGGETTREERDWRVNVTTLDAQQGGSVATAVAGHAVSTIDGFRITNGSAESGGGIYCLSAPTIANNAITANSATYGGGIYGSRSSPTITSNTITANSAAYGGGLSLSFSSATIANNTITANGVALRGGGLFLALFSGTVTNNTITGNRASDDNGGGGGIYCTFASSFPTIANNTITGNIVDDGKGGGIWVSGPVAMVNNTVTGNSAAQEGGGIYCVGTPTIINNTITGNSAAWEGGGIYCGSASSPTIANTIVAFNSSGIHNSIGSPVLRYNCVYANTAYNYSSITDPTGTDGNISADPLFVDKDAGDYRLATGSPCVDAGRNADVPVDSPDLDGDGDTAEPLPFDIEGDPRFVNDPVTVDCRWAPGTCGDAPIVDMGAYESPGYMLVAIAWRSVMTHGALGDLPITFDPAASGSAVGCETRRFGMQRMEVDFNADISGLVTGTVVAEDLARGKTIAATAQYTINGGRTLVVEFKFVDPAGREIALPNAACYRIDLAANIAGWCGDTDCEFRVLAGDINGTAPPYGDGQTDLTDMAQVKSMNGAPVVGDNIRLDVNIDGKIDLTDMALVKYLNGGSSACP